MPVFTDQAGRTVEIHSCQRIISIVPSQTEVLYDLGLEETVAGITKFCVHPEGWFRTKTRVGGTKELKMDIIRDLQPDLIIANKEENVKEQVEELSLHYPVWVSDINSLEDALEMIGQIGKIVDRETRASEMITTIMENFSKLQLHLSPEVITGDLKSKDDLTTFGYRLPTLNSRLKTVYLIWQNPFMTAGGDTFIHSMLEAAGFENIFRNKKRYPELDLSELLAAGCELLLLSSEPFPFKQKHIDELQPYLPDTKILLVDGEMFSWYGSRLLQAPAYFRALWQRL